MNSDVFVSVIAPARGEGSLLVGFLHALSSVLRQTYQNYEIIVVDDLSSGDNAMPLREALKEIDCLRIIRLSRRFSFDVAATAGLDSSIGDFVAIIDPLTDPPEKIPEMILRASEGIGVVVGLDSTPPARSWIARQLADFFHWYVKKFLGVDLVPNSTNFRVLSRQAVNAVMGIKGRYRQLRFLTSTVGFGQHTVSYNRRRDAETISAGAFWTQASEAADMLIANSTHPLRVVSLLGLGASALNFFYLIYVVAVYLLKNDVAPGWTTLSLQNGGMFFLLFLLLAILSEYVGRILAETRIQPLYNVFDELNSSVLIQNAGTRRNIVKESI